MSYSVLFFIIIAVEIIVAVYIVIKYKNSTLGDLVKSEIEKVFEDGQHHDLVEKTQQYFECCGTDGPKFWKEEVPDSCFPNKSRTEQQFKEGCTHMLFEFFCKNKNIMGYSALGFAVFEVVAFMFSCVLAKNVG